METESGMTITRRIFLALTLSLAVASGGAPVQAQSAGLTVFAAASLKNALDDAAARWTAAGHPAPRISYAGSNTLAQQIEQGAPADIFFSADEKWMDDVAKKGLIQPDTRVDLLGNQIVLIAPKDAATPIDIYTGFDLAKALGAGRLAMANVDAVPAGIYGKAALEKLGAWNGVKDHIAQAENVRAALAFVSRGEAPLGIVYATDAAADPTVKIVGTFPADTHPPIIYPVAVIKGATSSDAKPFLAFLRGPDAKAAFEKQGFTVINRAGNGS